MFKLQLKKMLLPVAACLPLVVAGLFVTSPRGLAQSGGASFDPARVEQGFDIAPVPLNYPKELRNYVGFGSWLINAVADCNGCHNGGTPPNLNYAPGGNPYFGQKAKVDPTVYLSGGQDFGQVTIDANFNPIGPHIISRNLTPDYTGRAEGGNTFEQFLQIIRHGTDFDHLHPPCTTDASTPPNCLFALPGINPVEWEPAPGYALARVQ